MKTKSNYELSKSIKSKREALSRVNEKIKDDSIKKNKLKQSIDDDVTELISRFKKEEKKGNKK